MKNLITKNYDSSLQAYELDWIESILKDFSKRDYYRNPSASFYISMVYGFAEHLPYSMDIEQPEYVPADFLNMMPVDVDENPWFKYEDRRTLFNAFANWGDTYKTAMILQLCFLFQKMILGEFPTDYELDEEKYTAWGIDAMTKNDEYNRRFFTILKSLPMYHHSLVSASTLEERRNILNQIYAEMISKLAARYGSFQKTDVDGKLVRKFEGSVSIKPSRDVSMFFHWDNFIYYDGIPSVISKIKEEQLKRYAPIRPQSLGETISQMRALTGQADDASTPKF